VPRLDTLPDHDQLEFHAAAYRIRERFLQSFMAEFDRRVKECMAGGSTPEQAGRCVMEQMEEFRREQAAIMADTLLAVEADILARDEGEE
jgi:hypothetical protein